MIKNALNSFWMAVFDGGGNRVPESKGTCSHLVSIRARTGIQDPSSQSRAGQEALTYPLLLIRQALG